MRMQVWLLRGGPFHFGHERGLGMEGSAVTWPADSLFAALVARLAQQDPDRATAWLEPFVQGHPPFLLTSTYPCWCPDENTTPVLFFPVPLAARRPGDTSAATNLPPKVLKRVQFVSLDLYTRLLQGQTLAQVAAHARVAGNGALLLSQDEWQRWPRTLRQAGENARLWKVAKRARVTVDRVSSCSNLFHVGAVHFRPDAGLWFGVVWRDPQSPWSTALPDLLEDLGQAGLGAERNVGYGRVTIAHGPCLTFPDPRPQGLQTTLSRYWPRAAEMDALRHPRAAYQALKVGGWMDQAGLRRRPVTMLAEGAVLPWLPPPAGRLEDVRPQVDARTPAHPVYRYGYALAVAYGGAA